MVFVNGQKFACATCIKGHRSSTCNHGERPLHEIKKKGRPSTQCPHCKELRKAKQVQVRCICGREEGSSAVVNGLKRAKSLSHDGRISVPAAIGGEDLLRSVSTQGLPLDQDASSSRGGLISCGCLEGNVCTCCRDRTGHVVVKPGKSSSVHASFKPLQANHQRSAASLDLGKTGLLAYSRETSSPLPFPPHANGGQLIQSPDSNASHILANKGHAISPLIVQTLSPSGSSGCDHSPSSSSSMGSQHSQMQPHLCFDYASSSDYDSDHYNPASSYSYFPETLASYPVSNASDEMEEMDMFNAVDSKKIMDGIMNGTTPLNPMEATSSDEIRMLYSALSSFSTASPPSMATPPIQDFNGLLPPQATAMHQQQQQQNQQSQRPLSPVKKGCCSGNSREAVASPAPSLSSTSSMAHSPSAGRSNDPSQDDTALSGTEGCGCAISPNMCCCGERCACPGCLAYPNNQNLLDTNLGMDMQSSREDSARSRSCCGSDKKNLAFVNDMALMNNMNSANNSSNGVSNGAQALNLTAALSLIDVNSRFGSGAVDLGVRQALRQEFNGMGLGGLDTTKMQHPTLLGDDGVLICGCGCGRPTVDCTECFRDMCQFVGESQARMMKDDLEYETAMNRAVGGLASGPGPNMNMSMSMNMGLGMDMGLDMNLNGLGLPFSQAHTMSLLSMQQQQQHQGSNGHSVDSSSSMVYQQQQQQQQQQHSKQPNQPFNQGSDLNGSNELLRQQLHQQQVLAQRMEQRLNLRRQYREGMEEEQKLQLQLMEQEQMQLQQSIPGLNHLQLDFLDDEDWSFVDEIRTEPSTDVSMGGVERS